LLILSWIPAIAEETTQSNILSSFLMITAIISGMKPAVDGVNGKLELSIDASQIFYGTNPVCLALQFYNNSQSSWSSGGQAIGIIFKFVTGHDSSSLGSLNHVIFILRVIREYTT